MSDTQAEIDALLAEAESLAGDGSESAAADAAGTVEHQGDTRSGGPSVPAGLEQGRLRQILSIEVPVIVVLAQRRMPLKEILRLSPGSIVEFDKPFDEELELLVNNCCIAYGLAVKVGENFGLKISRITGLRQRIDALGSDRNDGSEP